MANEPSVQIIGIHKLDVSDDLLDEAWQLKYEGRSLRPLQRAQARRELQRELGSVYLLEVVIDRPGRPFDLCDFYQEMPALLASERQVPYLDNVLSPDGGKTITDVWSALRNIPELLERPFRLAFFLHFVDPTKPLHTPFGVVPLPRVTPLPARLANIRYHPVD